MGGLGLRGRAASGLMLACGLLPLAACLRIGYEAVDPPDGGTQQPTGGHPSIDAGLDASLPGTEMDAGDFTGSNDASASPPADASGNADGSASSDAAGPSGSDAGDGGFPASGSEDRVEAASEVQVGTFIFNGSGCPAETASADLTDRPMRFQVNLQQFTLPAKPGGSAIVSCSFALELGAPAGVSLRMVGGSWQGDHSMAASGSTTLDASYFFTGDSARTNTHDLTTADMSFEIDDDVRDPADSSAGWTTCSSQTTELIARATLSLIGSDNVTFTIRSGSVFRIESQYCTP